MKNYSRLILLLILLALALSLFVHDFLGKHIPMRSEMGVEMCGGVKSIDYYFFPYRGSNQISVEITHVGRGTWVSKKTALGHQGGLMKLEAWDKLWETFTNAEFYSISNHNVAEPNDEHRLRVWNHESAQYNGINFDETTLQSDSQYKLLYTSLWSALESVDWKTK